ncbi:MAG: ArsA family ATPase [Acidimicrobiales bacterium]
MTGKGGVGKTTVAAALALLAAERGKKTLLCEVDAKGDAARSVGAAGFGFEARQVGPRLWGMSMSTEASLREYLRLYLRLPVPLQLGPLAKALDFVATAAPGVKEVLTVGKLCYEVRADHYDLVVVDAAATGHIVGQLAAPLAINDMVQFGLVRQQTGWMLDILSDPAVTGACIVSTPEEMPVNESIELAAAIAAETPVHLACTVVNRVLPELFARAEEAVFAGLSTEHGRQELRALLGGDPGPLVQAAELAVSLRRQAATHLQRLRESLPAGVATLYVPYLFSGAEGPRAAHQVAEAISAELGY